MRLYLIVNEEKHVEVDESVDFFLESLNYNPLEVGNGVVGFHLRGGEVVPVVDLNTLLSLPRGGKFAYINVGDVTFFLSYKSFTLERPESERIDLEELKGGVLEFLGVERWKGSKT